MQKLPLQNMLSDYDIIKFNKQWHSAWKLGYYDYKEMWIGLSLVWFSLEESQYLLLLLK